MAPSINEIKKHSKPNHAYDPPNLEYTKQQSLQTPLSEIEAAWAQAIEERIAEFDRGEAQAYAAEDVFAEARRLTR